MRVTLEIPGKPFAKQRPRFSRRNGRAYTPAETVSFENLVRGMALSVFPEPLDGPVKVEIFAVFEPPPSWSKKKRDAAMWTPHTQRPDRDNIEKAILDGLNRVAFKDDAQVFDGRTTKKWGREAKTIVIVEAADVV